MIIKNYLRYLYAILAVPAVILIRFALLPLTGHGTPFITLFPATVIIALLGGMGPAILTGVVGVLLSDYFFIEPLHSWDIGVEFWSRTAIVVMTSVFVGYVGAVLRGARARAEKQSIELSRSRQDLERAQTVALTGSWRLDVRNNELTWSNEAYHIFGVPAETPLTYESFLGFIHPDDRKYVDQKWEEALKGEKYNIEHRIVVDGQIKWVRERAELEYEKDGTLLSGFGTVTDITERKKREETLNQLNRTLRALTDSTQAMMHAKDESDYIQEVCNIITKDCGHKMVWVGFAENDREKNVRPAAYSGFDKSYVETLEVSWADVPRGRGPTGTAIRTGTVSLCKNMLTNPAFEPWRADALKRGYASSISLPLMNGQTAFGALTIYSTQPDPFSEDEVNLLKELTNDLAYGISVIRSRIARDEVQKALQESEATLRGILDATKESIWLFTTDGVVLMGNPTALSRFENPADEIIGKHFSDFLPEDLARSRLARLREAVESARPLEFEDTRNDIIFRHSFYPVQDNQGRVTSVVSFSRDITEQKLAEKALSESERKYRELVQNANSAIIRWNRKGNITLFNEYAEQFFGYSVNEVLGKKVDILLPKGQSGETNPSELIEGIINEPQRYINNVNENVCRDGRRVWMAWTNKPIYDENGQVSEILAVGTDITQRRRMEEELRKSRDELEIRVKERTAELQHINERLKEENEERLRTEQSLRLEEARLDALLKLSQISDVPIDRITGYTLEQAISLTRSKIGFIGFLSEDESNYTLHAVSKDVVKDCEVTGNPVQWKIEDAGLWADALRKRKTLFINDYSKSLLGKKGLPPGHVPIERFLVAPVFVDDKIVAVAGVGNKNSDYNESDERQIVLLLNGMWNYVQRNRSRESLMAERQRFNDVLETLPVYVCLLTPDYYMPFANKVFRDLFGYYPDKKCYEFLFNRLEPCENCETFKVLKTGKPQHWEWTGPNRRNYDIYDFPFKDTDGSRLILEMGIDITERKQAQDALRSTSLYVRGLLEASLDPLVTISPGGKITDVNKATVKVTGVGREQLIGTDFSNYFTEPQKAEESYQQVFAKGFVTDYPLTIKHRNGRLTDVLYNATVYKNQEGKVQGVFAAARDITEKKITEAELEKYRLHLEDLVKQRTDELGRSNKDLEQFAYVASHDLQEPLRAVSGFVSLLRHRLEDTLDEKTKEYMNFTVDGVSRMQTLINGLLAYSRIDTRGKPPQKTDSGKALEEALLGLQRSIKESAAEITYDNLPTVNIDPVQLSQLFQNLISNAIKFHGDSPPQIHVSADHQDNAWRFAVKDNGIGIEPQYAERIFLIFQRLHTRKKYTGTGIGLSLCKKIVERHGGKIWVESEPGHGSTFYFTIPDIEGALE